MYIKTVLKSLSKKKLNALLIIFQLSISFLIIVNAFKFIDQVNYQSNSIKNNLNINLDKTYRVMFKNVEETKDYINRLHRLREYVGTLDGVVGYGAYDEMGVIFDELRMDDKYINRNLEIKKTVRSLTYPELSDVIFINSSILNFTNMEVEMGRMLERQDFNLRQGMQVPILVGSAYKDVLKLGDILTITEYEMRKNQKKEFKTEFKVIGFIKQGEKWFSDDDFVMEPLEKLDDKFVAPNYLFNQESIISNLSTLHKVFIQMEDDANDKIILREVREKGLEYNLNIDFKSIVELLNEYNEGYSEIIQINLLLGVFLVVMSLIGIVSIMLINIRSRYKEFGIRIMSGASIRYIQMIIIGEMIFMLVFSFVLSFLFRISFEGISSFRNTMFFMLNSNSFIYLFFIASLVVFVAIIYPTIVIGKIQPSQLIKGED
ncbi:MAG: ABC transporter permease [Tissierellales bacterium]|jgi:putative ABC transport system permease protein|nr:ABC transporter permease [Tissierellales bacterium]